MQGARENGAGYFVPYAFCVSTLLVARYAPVTYVPNFLPSDYNKNIKQ